MTHPVKKVPIHLQVRNTGFSTRFLLETSYILDCLAAGGLSRLFPAIDRVSEAALYMRLCTSPAIAILTSTQSAAARCHRSSFSFSFKDHLLKPNQFMNSVDLKQTLYVVKGLKVVSGLSVISRLCLFCARPLS